MSQVASAPAMGPNDAPERLSALSRFLRVSRIDRFGAVYVLVAIVILFSILAPDTFPTWNTAKSICNQNATIAVLSLALVVPLSTSVFDLSIGNVVALMTVLIAWLSVTEGLPIWLAIVLALAGALLVGVGNAAIVVGIGIDSFIATLGTGAILQAVTLLISNEETVTSPSFSIGITKISTVNVGGIQLPAIAAIVVAFGLWWVMEHTVTGRRFYATGFNDEAARLAGVRIKRLRLMGLLAAAFIAGVAGVLVTATIGAGSPDAGPQYLLNAFAAAFLGATQIRNGRFNAWGTIIAVLVLGAGQTGLLQIGGAAWTTQMYTGVVLIVALAFTRLEQRQVQAGKASPVHTTDTELQIAAEVEGSASDDDNPTTSR
jgi:ribose transport system permease protein